LSTQQVYAAFYRSGNTGGGGGPNKVSPDDALNPQRAAGGEQVAFDDLIRRYRALVCLKYLAGRGDTYTAHQQKQSEGEEPPLHPVIAPFTIMTILPECAGVMRISQPAFMLFGVRIDSIKVKVRSGHWLNILFIETVKPHGNYQ
jgi:hypothetical protein